MGTVAKFLHGNFGGVDFTGDVMDGEFLVNLNAFDDGSGTDVAMIRAYGGC